MWPLALTLFRLGVEVLQTLAQSLFTRVHQVVLSLRTWNVRTLVDTDGNLNTASKAKKSRKGCSNIREESRRRQDIARHRCTSRRSIAIITPEESRRRQDIARHRCTSRRSIAIITRGNAPSRRSSGPGAASRRQR